MVDWARATGFRVAAAGKGTKYLPHYHAVTPDDVWTHYGLTPDAAAQAGMNPQMFNSFLDGTKSGIEMVAIANACGLDVPDRGLAFPPCGAEDLAHVLRPRAVVCRGDVVAPPKNGWRPPWRIWGRDWRMQPCGVVATSKVWRSQSAVWGGRNGRAKLSCGSLCSA